MAHDLFEVFYTTAGSPLVPYLRETREKGKLSRASFSKALKTVRCLFRNPYPARIYEVMSPYYRAVITGLIGLGVIPFARSGEFHVFTVLFKDIAPLAFGGRYQKPIAFLTYQEELRPVFAGLDPRILEWSSILDRIALLRDLRSDGFKIE